MNVKELMHRMWDNAERQERYIVWGEKHVLRFGICFYFMPQYAPLRHRLAKYKELRYYYVCMALALSKKLRLRRYAERSNYDH